MKKDVNLVTITMILLSAAAALFLADWCRTEREIREFDRQMRRWKQEELRKERK